MTTNRHARRAAAAKEAKGDASAIEGAAPAANDQGGRIDGKPFSVTLTAEEGTALLNMIDGHVRSTGLRDAGLALMLVAKLDNAFRAAQAKGAPAK